MKLILSYDRLLESKHLSCFEHCAKVMSSDEFNLCKRADKLFRN